MLHVLLIQLQLTALARTSRAGLPHGGQLSQPHTLRATVVNAIMELTEFSISIAANVRECFLRLLMQVTHVPTETRDVTLSKDGTLTEAKP